MDTRGAMEAEDGVRSSARRGRAGECSGRLASNLSKCMSKSLEEAAGSPIAPVDPTTSSSRKPSRNMTTRISIASPPPSSLGGPGESRNSFSGSGRDTTPFSGPALGEASRAIPIWIGARAGSLRLLRSSAPSFRSTWTYCDRFSVRLGAVSPSRPQFHTAWRGGPGQGSAPPCADRVAARPLGSVLEAGRSAKPRSDRRADHD